MQIPRAKSGAGLLLMAVMTVLCQVSCNTLSLFDDPPREKPCGVADGETGAIRVCPEEYPWCSCLTQTCARVSSDSCDSGLVNVDGSCLTLEEAGSIQPSRSDYHPTCAIVCSEDNNCDDGSVCNGRETCVDSFCESAGNAPDDASCMMLQGETGVCRAGRCTVSTCGNGVVDEPYEECDDGNLDDRNDDCRNDCTWRCVMDVQCADDEPCNGTEQCDLEQHLCLPGSPWANETRCSKLGMVGRCKAARCVPEECGNQVVDPGEECDDGNQSDNDECLIHCIENMCGDGFVLAGTEDCDDANMIDGDGCDSNCMYTCITHEQCRLEGVCRLCEAHQCEGASLPDGTECDSDGDLNTLEQCSEGACVSAGE